jgi:hypothetical protein
MAKEKEEAIVEYCFPYPRRLHRTFLAGKVKSKVDSCNMQLCSQQDSALVGHVVTSSRLGLGQ